MERHERGLHAFRPGANEASVADVCFRCAPRRAVSREPAAIEPRPSGIELWRHGYGNHAVSPDTDVATAAEAPPALPARPRRRAGPRPQAPTHRRTSQAHPAGPAAPSGHLSATIGA